MRLPKIYQSKKKPIQKDMKTNTFYLYSTIPLSLLRFQVTNNKQITGYYLVVTGLDTTAKFDTRVTF